MQGAWPPLKKEAARPKCRFKSVDRAAKALHHPERRFHFSLSDKGILLNTQEPLSDGYTKPEDPLLIPASGVNLAQAKRRR